MCHISFVKQTGQIWQQGIGKKGNRGIFQGLSRANVKNRKTKGIKTELWEQNKTELINEKEKIDKTNYIQLSKYTYKIFTSLFFHKFVTCINLKILSNQSSLIHDSGTIFQNTF